MERAIDGNNKRYHEHGSSGLGRTGVFLRMLIVLAVVLACGKLLSDGGRSWDRWSTKADIEKADAWNLILVNRQNHIPDDYRVDLIRLSNGQYVDKRIYPALQAMCDDARNAGIYPVVASGYRTEEYQQSLMDDKIEEYKRQGYSSSKARELAAQRVAVSRTSEHQLGIAVDINADTKRSTGYEVYRWLNRNSYKYGFILRYPVDKMDMTGTIYEPWHFRYVGVEAATRIYTEGLCLEEYLESLR